MRPLLKFVHLLSVVGFIGALVVALVQAANAPTTTAEAFATARESILAACNMVALPALLLVITSGMLLMVTAPGFIDARWVWAKGLIGFVLAAVAFAAWLPAVNQLASTATSAAFGNPILRAQDAAAQAEWIWGLVTLVLALAAVALAVWRPRLGRGV